MVKNKRRLFKGCDIGIPQRNQGFFAIQHSNATNHQGLNANNHQETNQ
jgi:hypothetical protein